MNMGRRVGTNGPNVNVNTGTCIVARTGYGHKSRPQILVDLRVAVVSMADP